MNNFNPTELGAWLVIAAAVMFMIRNGMGLVNDLRGKGPIPPYHEQFADRHLTDSRIKRVEAEVQQMRDDFNSRLTAMRTESRTQYDSIMVAGEERARLIHERINSIPQQIIQTLKDTKGLLDTHYRGDNS
jgi:hypothetical protein